MLFSHLPTMSFICREIPEWARDRQLFAGFPRPWVHSGVPHSNGILFSRAHTAPCAYLRAVELYTHFPPIVLGGKLKSIRIKSTEVGSRGFFPVFDAHLCYVSQCLKRQKPLDLRRDTYIIATTLRAGVARETSGTLCPL